MLIERQNKKNDGFANSLESYLGNILHDHIRVAKYTRTESLPSFLKYDYVFYESIIANRRCLFLEPVADNATPSKIAKHIALVNSQEDSIVALATTSLDAYNRARLIQHGVPFIIPGNQLYIPQLAMDLREHFRTPKAKRTDRLTPVAQLVLFHYILHPAARAYMDASRRSSGLVCSWPQSLLAKELKYTSMSIGRAFDDLINFGLADENFGKKIKHIRFKAEGRDLLESAKEFIRSPVRTERFVRKGGSYSNLKRAGETALAELSDLSSPSMDTFAVAASAWKAIAKADEFVETTRYQAEAVVETWIYNPNLLSPKETVDPLSLYAQFHKHEDERVVMAANKILDSIEW